MKEYKNKDWLEGKYIDNKLSTVQIGKICKCSKPTIRHWLKKFNIPIRSVSKALHLAKVNHCKLSYKAKQWISGELLSDGCLHSYSKYSAHFVYGSKYKEYIQYISDTLKSFGIKQTGKIYKRYHKEYNCYTYQYGSLSYKELLPIRNLWYPNRKKIIPRDLKLTPIILLHEMIGDGSLKHPKKGKPYIILATCGFPIKDVKWLVEKLNKLGFISTRQPSNNTIYISTYSTKDFLKYIGNKSPIKCYDYKFNY